MKTFFFTEISKKYGSVLFSLKGILKKSTRSGDGKRNNLLGWPNNKRWMRESFSYCLPFNDRKIFNVDLHL